MSNSDTVKKLIELFSGQTNIIAIPRLYIQLFDGDIDTALFLSQVVYWSDKSKRSDGFFYKTYAEWRDEIGMSEYRIKKAADKLESKGLLETTRKRANGAPTMHYHIDMDKLKNLIIEFFDNQETSESESEETSDSETEKTSESLTETTTSTTQETTVLLVSSIRKIFNLYEQEIGVLTPMVSEQLQDIDKEYPDGWFEKALRTARKSTNRITLGYVMAILKRWKTDGIDYYEEEKEKPVKKVVYKDVFVDGEWKVTPVEVDDES